ncbi:MAG: M23 family metallopeptidase [Caulobacteraceae bacterium]
MAANAYAVATTAVFAALGLAAPVRAASSATPVAVSVPFAPSPVETGGARRLFYELHLTNYANEPLTIDEIEIRSGDGRVMNEFRGEAVTPLLERSGEAEKPSREIPARGFRVLFLDTPLPAGPVPADLRWRLGVSRAATADPAKHTQDPSAIDGVLAIDRRPPVAIAFPLPPGVWAAANGPSNTSDHRRSLQVVDGKARISQRYAIDWIKLGPGGRPFHGDKAVNANWYGFGQPVLAVADATVASTHDGVPENEPADKRAVPITLETVGGNDVILNLGDGRFAFYAHLQPGSLRVHVGDHVHVGQVLGLLGNTGNSDAPHLHFHVADANSPLGAEGVPYVFRSWRRLGKASFEQLVGPGWKASSSARTAPVTLALPAEDEVVEAL